MGIKNENVMKALNELESQLQVGEEVVKASEQGLDQPEGDDLGAGHQKGGKMSDAAKAKAKKSEATEEDEAQKSYNEELPEEIQTKIDVSEFLKSLVEHTGKAIDGLKDHVAKGENQHTERYNELTETIEDVQKSQAKIGIVLKAICERIGVIENSPARVTKSETVQKGGNGAAERSFVKPEGAEEPQTLFKGMSTNPVVARTQVSNILCDLVKSGDAEEMDVISFESGNYIRPELVTKLKEKLN